MIRSGTPWGPSPLSRIFHKHRPGGRLGAAAVPPPSRAGETAGSTPLGECRHPGGRALAIPSGGASPSKLQPAGMAATRGSGGVLRLHGSPGRSGPGGGSVVSSGVLSGAPEPPTGAVSLRRGGPSRTSVKPWPCCRHTPPGHRRRAGAPERGVGPGGKPPPSPPTPPPSGSPTTRGHAPLRRPLQPPVLCGGGAGPWPGGAGELRGRAAGSWIGRVMARVQVEESSVLEAAYPERWGATLRWSGDTGGWRRSPSPTRRGIRSAHSPPCNWRRR